MINPERRLWREVLIQAAKDARYNVTDAGYNVYGAEWHKSWVRNGHARLVCELAHIDYGCVKEYFDKVAEENHRPEMKKNMVKFKTSYKRIVDGE